MRISLWIAYLTLLAPLGCWGDDAAATRWLDHEFKPSTLTREQQQQELHWFIQAADSLKRQGITSIHVVSEKIDTHEYESRTLAKAFEEITGIAIKHDIMPEGDLVNKL